MREAGSGSSRRRSINGRTKGGGGERRREKEVGTRKNAANALKEGEKYRGGVGCRESHRAQNVVIRQTRKSRTPLHLSASICGSSARLRGPCVPSGAAGISRCRSGCDRASEQASGWRRSIARPASLTAHHRSPTWSSSTSSTDQCCSLCVLVV